jgi:hypothetical protein
LNALETSQTTFHTGFIESDDGLAQQIVDLGNQTCEICAKRSVRPAPDTMVGQIQNGEHVVLTRPASPHILTASNAGGDINQRFGRSGPARRLVD